MKAKVLAGLVCLLLPACTTFIVHPDGTCEVKTPRKVAMSCNGQTLITSEVLLDQESIKALSSTAAEVIANGNY